MNSDQSIAADATRVPLPDEGRKRVVIEKVTPQIEGGRFPIKRVIGETVVVKADVFSDGHDEVAAILFHRCGDEQEWEELPMLPLGNDRWQAAFTVAKPGPHFYTVCGRIDHFITWRKDLQKRADAGQALSVEGRIGAEIVQEAALVATGAERELLNAAAARLASAAGEAALLVLARDKEIARLMSRHYRRSLATTYHTLQVVVEQRGALFSAWYELFPRSCCRGSVAHGTFSQCEELLPHIAGMGFDVVYFPPIHPIGFTNRKGKNNAVVAEAEDPGSPWAIGAVEGGHKELHPDLGSLADFRRFVMKAGELGLRVAMDIAFQCSPDHPYVRDHPEWFRWRPDGTVQYAENPPKKYEDIIPFDFETEEWRSLWEELKSIFIFWAGQGVEIFRVDNPHTKPFPLWEWLIAGVRSSHPGTIFLAEAFTRPKVMYRLGKLGFSQSYTYFSWRNTRQELEQYLTELTRTEVREFFRPNFWPNTPDILPEILQFGGPPAFAIRFLLAATLSSSYGIYGPPFDLFIGDAMPEKEEYLHSEKYEIRCWDWNDPRNLRNLITRVNSIRRDNPALQSTWNLTFCESDNDNILCYLKRSDDGTNILLIAVTLDPFNDQGGNLRVPLEKLNIGPGQPYLVQDLLTDERQVWHGEWNRVSLSLSGFPGKIWRLRPRLRRENDFDYFM